jgi:bacteriophage N4 adsorption protein B
MVWGNIINFSATCRAISLYSRYLRTGKLISWDKTAHVFPSEAELQAFRRKLGDLLLERR